MTPCNPRACLGLAWALPYFAVYDEHFFAQIFEGKIKMRIIHGHYDGHNNPMYNEQKDVGAHYTWQKTVVPMPGGFR